MKRRIFYMKTNEENVINEISKKYNKNKKLIERMLEILLYNSYTIKESYEIIMEFYEGR